MVDTPDVTVLIINYKKPDLCIDCINSLREHTQNVSYETLVIDNNSNDNVETLLKEHFGQEVKFFGSKTNLGTVRAYNLGRTFAHGRYLFLLNSDTQFINNAILQMRDFLDKNEKTAMVGANLYHPDMTQAHSYKKYYSLRTIRKECRLPFLIHFALSKNKRNFDFNNSGVPTQVMYVCAAAAMIRKSALDQIGWFSEDRFMYGEEPDIAEAFRQIGYNVFNVPDAKLIHFEGASGSEKIFSFSKTSFLFSLQGNGAFFRKWTGENGQRIYYHCLKKELKNKELLSFFSAHRALFQKYRSMRKVLSSYLKDKNAIDSQILSIR